MLIYSTRFKVKDIFTKEQFVKSLIKWCTEKKQPLSGLENHKSDFSFSEIDGNQMIEVVDVETDSIIAARQISETLKGNWTVDAVLDYGKKTLSVYMDYTVNDSSETSNTHLRAPRLIRQIINDGFAENNLGFEMKTSAITLEDKDREKLISALNASDTYALPFVYLSSRSDVDADVLAQKLSGLAVVIEDTSDILNSVAPERFTAPIYVLLPHKGADPLAFGNYPLHREIIHTVANYLNRRVYDKLETWDGVNGKLLRIRSRETIEKLKEKSDNNDFNKIYLEELEAENEKYSQKYEKLAEELQKLKLENERLNYRLESYTGAGNSLIVSGTENDLYPNEQREIIIDCLKEYLDKNVQSASRRADIIKSIINANHVDGIPDQYKKIIKAAFDGYKKFECFEIMDALKKTGIVVVEHTGHYKIQYHKDPRYSFEASATASDHRAGKNAASIINNLMF
ncbi:hypothetical protein [Ruminococcus sp. XPD3002]|uniref:hypothetical protein n=1 Tax=Ruminococcus sp. XPD3002 TaxID=1452269 RepID=UPI0009249F61|nr:hypothetical protein SAMN04487832_1052 [Ruminococcus flavefaciens]